jgi:hypothetical protein
VQINARLLDRLETPTTGPSLGVEQLMPRICVRLTPLPQVFRHSALLGLQKQPTASHQSLVEPGGIAL